MSTEPTSTPPKTAELEIVEKPQVDALVKQHQLSAETADQLLQSFKPFFTAVHQLLEDAKRVEVTDATQVSVMKHARELRLKLREQRVKADKARELLKAESLRRGKAIDGVYNILEFQVKPIEEKLLAAEEYAERIEAQRKEELKKKRFDELKETGVDPQFYQLADMPDDQYQKLLAGAKEAKARQEAEAKRIADEKAAKEKADAEEREKQRLETERLKKEAAERAAEQERQQKVGEERAGYLDKAGILFPTDSALLLGSLSMEKFTELKQTRAHDKLERERKEKERADAEAKAEEALRKLNEAEEQTAREIAALKKKQEEERRAEQAERDRQAKAEAERLRAEEEKRQRETDARMAELKKKADDEAKARREVEEREAKRLADEKAAADRAAAAPDKEKLIAMADRIDALLLPEMSTSDAKKLAAKFALQRAKFSTWLRQQSELLGATQSELPTS